MTIRIAILFVFFVFTTSLVKAQEYSRTSTQGDSVFAVSISPNPFVDDINININHGHKNLKYFKITDAIGKDVFQMDLNNSINTSKVLDFSGMRPGIYFLTVYYDQGIIETRRLFKSR